MGETYGRTGADDQGVEIAYPRLTLRGDAACIARAWSRHQLGFEAKLLL